jgi:AraC-like DNA-binding protein
VFKKQLGMSPSQFKKQGRLDHWWKNSAIDKFIGEFVSKIRSFVA